MESSSELSGSSDSENHRETQLQPGDDSEQHPELFGYKSKNGVSVDDREKKAAKRKHDDDKDVDDEPSAKMPKTADLSELPQPEHTTTTSGLSPDCDIETDKGTESTEEKTQKSFTERKSSYSVASKLDEILTTVNNLEIRMSSMFVTPSPAPGMEPLESCNANQIRTFCHEEQHVHGTRRARQQEADNITRNPVTETERELAHLMLHLNL